MYTNDMVAIKRRLKKLLNEPWLWCTTFVSLHYDKEVYVQIFCHEHNLLYVNNRWDGITYVEGPKFYTKKEIKDTLTMIFIDDIVYYILSFMKLA